MYISSEINLRKLSGHLKLLAIGCNAKKRALRRCGFFLRRAKKSIFSSISRKLAQKKLILFEFHWLKRV